MRKYRVLFSLIAWTAVLSTALLLSKRDLIPGWVFYALLIGMHVWIFTRIALKIYYLKKKNIP